MESKRDKHPWLEISSKITSISQLNYYSTFHNSLNDRQNTKTDVRRLIIKNKIENQILHNGCDTLHFTLLLRIRINLKNVKLLAKHEEIQFGEDWLSIIGNRTNFKGFKFTRTKFKPDDDFLSSHCLGRDYSKFHTSHK